MGLGAVRNGERGLDGWRGKIGMGDGKVWVQIMLRVPANGGIDGCSYLGGKVRGLGSRTLGVFEVWAAMRVNSMSKRLM